MNINQFEILKIPSRKNYAPELAPKIKTGPNHVKCYNFVSLTDNHLKFKTYMEHIYAHILTEFQSNSFRTIAAGGSLFVVDDTGVNVTNTSFDTLNVSDTFSR